MVSSIPDVSWISSDFICRDRGRGTTTRNRKSLACHHRLHRSIDVIEEHPLPSRDISMSSVSSAAEWSRVILIDVIEEHRPPFSRSELDFAILAFTQLLWICVCACVCVCVLGTRVGRRRGGDHWSFLIQRFVRNVPPPPQLANRSVIISQIESIKEEKTKDNINHPIMIELSIIKQKLPNKNRSSIKKKLRLKLWK